MSMRTSTFVFAAVALFSGFCLGEPVAKAIPRAADATILHPINLRSYEAAMGLQRRDGVDFTDLDPSTQSQLIYGTPGEQGQLLLANMTLYAPEGLPIVLMERFEGLTSAVDCKGDDGAMSLTFKSKEAYEYALKAWQYINEDEHKQFLLIANHDGCGPDDERQPYKVSWVTEDAADLTIDMKTKVAAWSEVAGSYAMDFGKAALRQPAQRVRSRGFWGDIVDVGKDVLNAATGDFDIDEGVTFAVNVGKAGQKTNILTDTKGRFSIDCIDCYITGSWEVQGHIEVDSFKLQDLTLSAAPQNFKAKLELEATVTASKTPFNLTESKEIFAAPIPGAGIAVTGIFKLGATVSYDVGVSASIAGSAAASFGLSASLPNSAKVVADINNPSDSSATGWEGSSLTPTFGVTKLSASIGLAAFSQPKISFGIELIKVGNVEIAVTMKLPEISSTLSAEYAPKGLCDQSAGASKTGVKFENKATESLSLQIDVDLGADNPKPTWNRVLWTDSQALGGACLPLPIPGLGPAKGTATSSASGGGATAAPATCKPAGKTGICQDTSKTCAGGAYVSGLCPGAANIKCCPDAASKPPSSPPSPSTTKPPAAGATCKPPGKTGGICQNTSKSCAGGAYVSGLCPGDNSIKCCPNVDTTPTTCKPPGKTGVCQNESLSCAGGAYVPGYCPGGNEIKCCPDAPAASTGGGGCKVRRDRLGRRALVC